VEVPDIPVHGADPPDPVGYPDGFEYVFHGPFPRLVIFFSNILYLLTESGFR